jgi:hypothetical protein
MNGGEISGNTASASASYGGGVYVDIDGTFTMSGGAQVNVNNPVCLYYSSSNSSITIGGDFAGATAPVALIDLQGNSSNWSGTAVLDLASGYTGDLSALKSRFVLGSFIPSSGTATPITGYAIADDGTLRQVSIGITNVSYSAVSGSSTWTVQGDGRRKSPTIGHSSVTKSRISFTAVRADAYITIQLDVSSEPNYDFAFISTLDNASATFENGDYPGSRISGTNSVTVSIPIPTAGSHFIEIGYRKDISGSHNSDCAWYKVLLE